MNVTEIFMGMRPGEQTKTEQLLRSLEFYPVTWEVAQFAGELFREWPQKGTPFLTPMSPSPPWR